MYIDTDTYRARAAETAKVSELFEIHTHKDQSLWLLIDTCGFKSRIGDEDGIIDNVSVILIDIYIKDTYLFTAQVRM